ncbi:MAG TPA: epimerase [Flavobacteriales bacterium]|jgi:nucleoside-diphosphate-sugar epimerase|nr:epimerase [Flavobacteriales bacterium]
MSSKVIVTGSTGMVGKAVLLECLDHQEISNVLVINRSSLNMNHPKLKEVLVADFMNLQKIEEQLAGYDACFHCMGVSAVGLSEETYTRLTFEVSEILANMMKRQNPNAVFTYVSGVGTDSSEKGRTMWARVKGRTENMILNIGFRDAYAFRPGAILPERGVKSKTGWYNAMYVIMKPFFPLFRKSPNVVGSTSIGKAMIQLLHEPYPKNVIDPRDIDRLANQLK